MEIRSLDNVWKLSLSVIETETEHFPSVRVSITLDGDFSVRDAPVWYGHDAITGFVAALRHVEKSRAGNATLDSMSPGKGRLRIACVGSLGHILLYLDMYRYSDLGSHPKNALAVAFELDREFFHRIISDFSDLAAVCRPTSRGR